MDQPQDKKTRQELTILIADDVSSARRVVRKQLEKLGFENFSECANGVEALAHLATKSVDLIISDWNMPEMGGIDLLAKIRELDHLKDIPFVMITSSADRENILLASQQGVTDYIVKPFSTDTLENKLIPLLNLCS